MPKDKEINHPCHLLSLPSAKRFWCRHCMTVFEDAITRWRHSRSCRYGVVNNFIRRRELEAKALQNTSVLNPVEARLEQSIQMCDLASASNPAEIDSSNDPEILSGQESFNCFICHQKFSSMEEMRIHVKYPCSSSKIITSCAPHPRHSVPVFIDTLPGQACQWQMPSQHLQNVVHSNSTFVSVQTPQHSNQTSYEIDIQSQQEVESQYDDTTVVYEHSGSSTSDGITPTNIYVNEQGETVIEVENFDLNSEGGELSLAHLLTQLSQQGIVFDKSRSAQLQSQHEITVSGNTSNALYTTEVTYQAEMSPNADEEEGQPTAEDAANTLAQLAGFRSFSRTGQMQPDGEAQLPSQGETYSYSLSSSEPGRQDILNEQSQIDIKYVYEYSDSSSASDQSTVNAQQMALQQVVVSESQEYEHDNVANTVTEETIQYYSDSSNTTYVTDPTSPHQIQVQSEISTENIKNNFVGNNGAESVVIQHYPLQVNGTEHLIIAPTIASGQHIIETHSEYAASEKHTAVEILLSADAEDSTLITNFNSNRSLQSVKNTESLTQGDPGQCHNMVGTGELSAQSLTVLEIVNKKSESQNVVGQTLQLKMTDSHNAAEYQQALDSLEKQSTKDNVSSLIDAPDASDNPDKPDTSPANGNVQQ